MRKVILLTLFLAGCSHNPPPPQPQWPIPTAGQWASAFGQVPGIIGTTFGIPGGQGIHYVYTPAAGLALGQTMTLTYTISGDTVVLSHVDPNDIDPPTISLFIWEQGDNLSCAGQFFSYRQFTRVRPNLELGTHTVSAVIDPSSWSGCGAGQPDAAFDAAVANAAYMGFTLGGQYFAGHGVYAQSGTPTFTINSFTVQ